MMRGWFDLFRENGGPTLYSHSNRTPVIGDVSTITLCIVFGTLYFAFFVIFPGVRRERFTTFLSVTLSLFVGTAILLGTSGSGWHTASAEIASAYRAFSTEKIMGRVGVYIGLAHTNVTLDAMPTYYNSTMDVHFNERFSWDGPTQLKEEYRDALVKGLPFPILTIVEYMAVDAEGFCWGRTYRSAGYYTSIFLWSSFVLWLVMNVLMVVVPRYGAYCMALTGANMLFADAVYYWMLPDKPLKIHIEEVEFTFELGWCFWLILVGGGLCLLVGGSISIIDLIYPHKFSTILEMDYGTPFDRHTIIEDSHEQKKKKRTAPKLEETMSVGFGGLLRRLSKRDREAGAGGGGLHHPGGRDNYAYEMETPKSPWRYPHLMFRESRKNKSVKFRQPGDNLPSDAINNRHRHNLHNAHLMDGVGMLRRNDSRDSTSSSIFPPSQSVMQQKLFRRTDSGESSASSMASSFGLASILSRNNSRAGGVGGTGAKVRGQSADRAGGMRPHPMVERNDSGESYTSRESGVQQPEPTQKGGDEVAILVSSGRKNSTTKAVRRNSAEHQRTEASMW